MFKANSFKSHYWRSRTLYGRNAVACLVTLAGTALITRAYQAAAGGRARLLAPALELTTTRVSRGAWKVAWSSTDPDATFWVYRDGVLLLADTRTTSIVLTVGPDDSPLIEVLDADPGVPGNPRPIAAFPSRVTLTWYAPTSGGVDYYRVEEYVGDPGEWILRQAVPEKGRGYYTWTSRVLEDAASHQFRVVPVAASGNRGNPIGLDVLMVRFPDAPKPAYAYDPDTAAVTIAA